MPPQTRTSSVDGGIPTVVCFRRRPHTSRIHLHVIAVVLAACAHCLCGLLAVAADDSTTATSTTTADTRCGGVERCLHYPLAHCNDCISSINDTVGFPHSSTEFLLLSRNSFRAYQVEFFRTLLSTASCSTNATPPSVLHPALQELMATTCWNEYGLAVNNCLLAEYACFVDHDCRECLAALYSETNTTKLDVLESSVCISTDPTLLKALSTRCSAFPTCSYSKQRCHNTPNCTQCLDTICAGEGAMSAQECPSAVPSGEAIDNFVSHCFYYSSVACEFFQQRCASNADCLRCLARLHSGCDQTAMAMVSEWSTPACQRATLNPETMRYLRSIAHTCPHITDGQIAITDCVATYPTVCIPCLNGSNEFPDICPIISQYYLMWAAFTYPESVHAINTIVLATATVGGASVLVCLAVIITMFAHGRDRRSMRDRIVIGLMLMNAVYSSANTLPLNALRTSANDCGRVFMSFNAIRFGRAWWFGGKFGLVSFELFIVGASIRALLLGQSAVPPCAEAALHTTCTVIAVTAFAAFYVMCASINAAGYNIETENEAFTNSYDHSSMDDDMDDSFPATEASTRFLNARNDYDNLVREMLLGWNVVVCVAVILWCLLRLTHKLVVWELLARKKAMERLEATDVWVNTRQSTWRAKYRLMEARREAFADLAKPLELYMAVFVLFYAPAIVMATSYCQRHSAADAVGASSATQLVDQSFTYVDAL